LRKIHKNPGFTAGAQVKISRSQVTMTRILTDLSIRNDWMLRRLFATAARGLPLAGLAETRRFHPPRPELIAETDPLSGEPSATRESEPLRRRSFGSSGS
jgi:hypothetical protein